MHEINLNDNRMIEQILIKMTPKQKKVLSDYLKDLGIKNQSDFVRDLVFGTIADYRENEEFTLRIS